MKTTNYYNTFIEIAGDSPVKKAEVPPLRGEKKTIARIQFEIINPNPYKYTSDDVLFAVHTERKNIKKNDLKLEREKFFSKGQPCMRSSPLTKRYGWGVHSDEAGRIALYAFESDEYKKLAADKNLTQLKAMRSKRI